jgi:hypothetical protein
MQGGWRAGYDQVNLRSIMSEEFRSTSVYVRCHLKNMTSVCKAKLIDIQSGSWTINMKSRVERLPIPGSDQQTH